jgi:chaperonin GroES
VAVGKGKVLESGEVKPLEVREGDRILFGSYAGTEVKHGGKDYLIVKESDILAVLN